MGPNSRNIFSTKHIVQSPPYRVTADGMLTPPTQLEVEKITAHQTVRCDGGSSPI